MAAAAAGAASAAAAPATHHADHSMNALRSTALRRSTLHWDAAAAFFSPPFRSRRCHRRVLLPPAAALPAKSRSRAKAKLLADAGAVDPWLASLSLLPADGSDAAAAAAPAPTGWAIGIDPDTRGAIAVLSPDGSSQVFDNPFVNIMVSELTRKRLDTRSIIQLLRGLDAPPGTTAFIEKSSPFPTDGKLGWWSTGFSYGLWIAALVASEFSVVPVASQTWKSYFGLTRSASPKDDSRRAATILFPDKALSLKLKKHHGRAEALLLAAYGKGLVLPSEKFIKTQRVLKQETNLTLTGTPD
ncbi:Holliday junction resolvase MOC1, chloroplastic-like [Triticum dicoccoides]|uniref:Holliday junction resolvase MOC1, chloroplastic-like n=1 Tax=Triticum dicoccoides TaxID=85692 RepID=UPI000E79D4A5|nr:Holliday junction resolvase MOC1, chloroplastic-like [Triticum dicoccoides]